MANKEFNILIVDDEAKNIKLVASILSVIPEYKTAFALDGKRALEMVLEEKYDLILLDINMPNIDGYEACSKIKKHPKTKNIPIIFLTAMLNDESMRKAFKCGAADYITKPVRKIELVSRIKTIFLMNQKDKEIIRLKKDIAFQKKVRNVSINAQTYPVIFHDKDKTTLCNTELLRILECQDMSEFHNKFSSIKKIFYDSNCIDYKLSDQMWLDSLSENDDLYRVSVKSKEGLKHYILNVEKISDIRHLNYIIFFKDIDKPIFTFDTGKNNKEPEKIKKVGKNEKK